MASTTLKSFPRYLQGRWAVLVLIVVWLMIFTGAFGGLSPADTPIDKQLVSTLTKVIATVVFGLVALLILNWTGVEHTRVWVVTVIITLGLGILAFSYYYNLRAIWTVNHAGRVFYIGTKLQASVEDWINRNNLNEGRTLTYTPEDLLNKDQWNPSKIWTEESIQRCRFILAILHITYTILFGLSVIFTAQLFSRVWGKTIEDSLPSGQPAGAELGKIQSDDNQRMENVSVVKPSRNQIFISYSHKDSKWLLKLQKMLKPLMRKGTVIVWDDSKIESGTKWKDEIQRSLSLAGVAVLLVSPNFLDSDFINQQELPLLLEAAETEGLTVLWVAISASLYSETRIADYQAANNPDKPLDTLAPAKLNLVLVDICNEIKAAYIKKGC